jgi:hypothetical protein
MNNRKIDDIINKAITKFNLISPKNMQIKNFKRTQFTKKLDSLNIINLLMSFEEVIRNKKIIDDMKKKTLYKIFKNYLSIKNFLKKYKL